MLGLHDAASCVWTITNTSPDLQLAVRVHPIIVLLMDSLTRTSRHYVWVALLLVCKVVYRWELICTEHQIVCD